MSLIKRWGLAEMPRHPGHPTGHGRLRRARLADGPGTAHLHPVELRGRPTVESSENERNDPALPKQEACRSRTSQRRVGGAWSLLVGGAKLDFASSPQQLLSPREKLLQFVFYMGITTRCQCFTLGSSLGEAIWD
jgi:hypothetical protein